MINLKKLFRRKKGQGALEYLFMIAAALIIIFVVVRYISGSTQQASSQTDIANLQSQAELAKSQLIAKDWWDNNYKLYWDGSQYMYIEDTTKDSDGPDNDDTYVAKIDVSNSAYIDDLKKVNSGAVNLGTSTNPIDTLGKIYTACMDDNNENACKILAALGGS